MSQEQKALSESYIIEGEASPREMIAPTSIEVGFGKVDWKDADSLPTIVMDCFDDSNQERRMIILQRKDVKPLIRALKTAYRKLK